MNLLNFELLVLHPGYRVQYLVKQGWPAKWIEEAKEVVRNVWQTTYRDLYEPDVKVKPVDPKKVRLAVEHLNGAHFAKLLNYQTLG